MTAGPSRYDRLYKRSRYVHAFREPDRSVFFNSLTLELYEGTDEDYRVWERYADPRRPGDTPEENRWLEVGFLVPEEADAPGQSLEKLRRLRRRSEEARPGRIGHLRISLTERCNMACTYCFQQHQFRGDQPVMSRERFADVMTWLVEQNDGCSPYVQYFGGEPLLEFDLIRYGDSLLRDARAAGRIEGYRQSITTNGTLMTDETARFLVDSDFDVAFSLDGWEELNDSARVFKNGRGTYRAVMKGIERYRRAGGAVSLLITPRANNVAMLPRIARHFADDLGAASIGINAPQPTARGWEVGGKELAKAVQQVWELCIRKRVGFHAPGTFIPGRIRRRQPQVDRCVDADPAGTMADWPAYVSAAGDVSYCLVQHNNPRLTRRRGEQLVDRRFRKWHFDTTDHPECDECIAGQICGGPCSLELALRDGALNPDRCAFFKSIVEWGVTK